MPVPQAAPDRLNTDSSLLVGLPGTTRNRNQAPVPQVALVKATAKEGGGTRRKTITDRFSAALLSYL